MHVKKVIGISSETSDAWFMNDESIEEFMHDRYFKTERGSEVPGLSFIPTGRVDVLVYVNEESREYTLVLGYADDEVTFDVGVISEEPVICGAEYSLRLSGIYLQDGRVVCEN